MQHTQSLESCGRAGSAKAEFSASTPSANRLRPSQSEQGAALQTPVLEQEGVGRGMSVDIHFHVSHITESKF